MHNSTSEESIIKYTLNGAAIDQSYSSKSAVENVNRRTRVASIEIIWIDKDTCKSCCPAFRWLFNFHFIKLEVISMMGNPYVRKRGAKSVSVRPFQQSGRDMSFLPVPLTTLDGGEKLRLH